ncbi:MAG: SirB1 family protein [Acidimicrobiales bacterium]
MTPTERFTELVRGPEADLALDEAALLIAAHAHPDADPAASLAELDRLAQGVAGKDLSGLLQRIYGQEGFAGNREDYYNPENSYLDTVLQRRRGIPISLAVVTIEVGRRCGVELVGVGMPGHFLCATVGPEPMYIDAFEGGVLLDQLGVTQRFAAMTGGQQLDPTLLGPLGPRAMLTRMLTNLGGIARQRKDHQLLQWVLQLRAVIPSRSLPERRDLASALVGSGRFDEAADVLEGLADDVGAPPDHEIRRQARSLRARLN